MENHQGIASSPAFFQECAEECLIDEEDFVDEDEEPVAKRTWPERAAIALLVLVGLTVAYGVFVFSYQVAEVLFKTNPTSLLAC